MVGDPKGLIFWDATSSFSLMVVLYICPNFSKRDLRNWIFC